MASRTISTRLAVEGESQYRAAISSVNAELKNMQSALAMTESQFAENATSTEALTAKGQALNNLLTVQKQKVADVEAGLKNAQESEQKYANRKEELTKKIEENAKALDALKSSSEDTSAEQKRLTEENQKLNKELEENEAYLKAAKRAVTNWNTDLNKAKTAVNQTEAAIRQNSDALEQNRNKAKENSDAINTLAAAMVSSGLKAGIEEIADALRDCVSASVEFESAMAGIAKTTDLSDDELTQMGESIKQLSTVIPITTTELAGIVETAGQLGIQKENLLSFAETMANLGVATNLTSEEAATLLARFANVTKMSPDLYGNLGSVVVALGNNFATTEAEIVAMGQRLAAGGELAGLTEPQIMALATAMSSVGIEAEAGGTAMTQTLTAIEKAVVNGNENLAKFAEISGMTAEQFSAAWKAEPIAAIQAFIRGLGELDAKGESATLVLDEMGLSGVRQSNMLKSLATASGLLTDAVDLASQAWVENTALTKEAETRYATTESKMTLLANAANNLKIAIGDQLSPALNDVVSSGTDLLEWATDFAEENEWLAPTILSVSAAMTVLLGAVTTATVVVPLLTKLVAALNASFLANPIALVATALATVTAAVVTFSATVPNAVEEVTALEDAMTKCSDTFETADKTYESSAKNINATAEVVDNYIDRLSELESQTSLTQSEQREYNMLVSEVARLMPEANTAIDETTGLLADGAEALRISADEWRNMAKAAAESARIQAMTEGLTDAYIALQTAQDELTIAQAGASDRAIAYADALSALYDAQENLSTVQRDSSSDYWDIEAAQTALNEAQNALIESAKGLSDEEKDAGNTIAGLSDALAESQANVDAYEEKMSALAEAMSNTSEQTENTAEGLERAAESMANIQESAGEGISESFTESISGMAESAETAMADTESAVIAGGETIKAAVTDAGAQSATGFDAEVVKVKDSATKAMSDAITAVNSYTGQARSAGYSVGASISQGAAAGVMAYAAQVAAQAAAMVTNAINAAKRAAASNSPSKKMIALGQDLDRGLIIGIKDKESEAISTMEDTLKSVVTPNIKMPEIPDYTQNINIAMRHGNEDATLIDAIAKLADSQRPNIDIDVTQNFDGEQQSYAGQQKAAAKEMKNLARELMR